MMLYHGTDAEHVDEILAEGLHPRNATGRSNWSEGMESIEGHVYLSALYAAYFGMAAVEHPEPYAVFEIDLSRLDHDKLYPDEDAIEQGFREGYIEEPAPEWFDPNADMTTRTTAVREHIGELQGFWHDSLNLLGNCSYRGSIPPVAITRVAIVDAPKELWWYIDPTITVLNAQILWDRYAMVTRLVMGDDVSVDEFLEASHMSIPDPEQLEQIDADNTKAFEAQRNLAEQLTANDEYVTVKENPAYMPANDRDPEP